MKQASITNFSSEKSIKKFFAGTTANMVAFASGLLTSDRDDHILATGRIIQAGLKGKMFKQLGQEIEELTGKGKIKQKWFDMEYARMSFVELLKFIDDDVPDEEKLKAMKALFYASAGEDTTKENTRLAYEFILICKQLDSGDIQILKAIYNYIIEPEASAIQIQTSSAIASGWFNDVSKLVGHGIASLVECHEEKLFKLRLISKRTYGDLSGFEQTEYYRMTELGYKLCEFITKV